MLKGRHFDGPAAIAVEMNGHRTQTSVRAVIVDDPAVLFFFHFFHPYDAVFGCDARSIGIVIGCDGVAFGKIIPVVFIRVGIDEQLIFVPIADRF